MEKSAAELVALLADGSFRDALSILQKVLTVSADTKVDVAEVEMVTGAPRGELVRTLLSGIARKDAPTALGAVQEAVAGNLDMRVLTRLLIHRLRVVLLVRYAPELAETMSHELSDADMALAQELAKEPNVNSDTLRAVLEAFNTMAYAAVQHLPLELAIIDICVKAA